MSVNHEADKCFSKSIPGDLVFFAEHDATNLGEAITESYSSEEKFLHVGILSSSTYPYYIIHSGDKITSEMRIEDVAKNNISPKGHVVVKQPPFGSFERKYILEESKKYLGTPPNDIFSDNNINSKGQFSFYCSQLVEHLYNKASQKPIFYKHPMSFSDSTGNIIPFWIDYFEERNHSIPEGELGTHPSSIAGSEYLTELCSFTASDF